VDIINPIKNNLIYMYMSISNLLQPNNYDLFCNSITSDGRWGFTRTTHQFGFISGNQSIPNGTSGTTVNWTAFSPSADDMPPPPYTYSNGVFTMTKNVSLTVSVQIKWAGNDTNIRAVRLRRNADVYSQVQVVDTGIVLNAAPSLNTQSISWTTVLGATGYFAIEVIQNSGGALDIQGNGSSSTYFCNINVVASY
jgi:hypothetical protein